MIAGVEAPVWAMPTPDIESKDNLISKMPLRNLDCVSLPTGAIFKDSLRDLGKLPSFCNISAYQAARTLMLIFIPMFMILRNPINMILWEKRLISRCLYYNFARKNEKIAKISYVFCDIHGYKSHFSLVLSSFNNNVQD